MGEALKPSPQIVNDYFRLFVNRRAYTLQSMRPHPESWRHYYFRPKKKGTGAPVELRTETKVNQQGVDEKGQSAHSSFRQSSTAGTMGFGTPDIDTAAVVHLEEGGEAV